LADDRCSFIDSCADFRLKKLQKAEFGQAQMRKKKDWLMNSVVTFAQLKLRTNSLKKSPAINEWR
jgi:hypothetical protein